MTTHSGSPASIASMTAAFANLGGTKTTEAFAPVALIASATVLKTGNVLPSISTLCPPLPGVTPPTIFVPYLSMRAVCLVPSEPVIPWTTTLVCLLMKIAIYFAANSAAFAAAPSIVSNCCTNGWPASLRILRPSMTLFPSRRTTIGLVALLPNISRA